MKLKVVTVTVSVKGGGGVTHKCATHPRPSTSKINEP